MSETFWYSDPSILFNKDTWYKFVPTARMSVPEALNSVVRFSIYMTILLVLTSHRPLYVLFVPTVMFISIVLNGYFPQTKKIVESFRSGTAISGYTGTEVTRPTLDNPFMNPTLVDIKENHKRPPAADPTDIKVRDDINSAFAQTSNIYMDTSDIFSLVQAQRNFYTVPEDDHEGLLKFLGKNAQSDKLLNEGYVAAKGTVTELPSPAVSKPSGSAPSSSLTG